MARPRFRKLGSPTLYIRETWERERPDLNSSDYLFLVYVMRLGRLIERLHDSYSRDKFGLSGADLRVLTVLRRSQSSHMPKPAELAEVQMVTTGAMAKQLVRLENLGLIGRAPNKDEGGGIAIYATEKGLELADRSMSTLIECSPTGAMKRSLSQKERQQLARLCEQLLIEFEDV